MLNALPIEVKEIVLDYLIGDKEHWKERMDDAINTIWSMENFSEECWYCLRSFKDTSISMDPRMCDDCDDKINLGWVQPDDWDENPGCKPFYPKTFQVKLQAKMDIRTYFKKL